MIFLNICMGRQKKQRYIIWMAQKLCPFYANLLENMVSRYLT